MRTKIEPESGAWSRLLAPSLAHLWAKAVNVGFKVAYFSQKS
jgi:hypothetical protein